MPIVDDDLLSAISAGADSANEPASTPEPEDTSSDTEENADAIAGESDEVGASSDDSTEADPAVDPAAEADPAAEPEALTDEQKAEKAAADATAAEDEAAAKQGKVRGPDGKFIAKTKDPVNDPIPKELKKETRERIQTLASTVKVVTGERDAVTKKFNELTGYIEETKATPQQYGDALSYLKLVNSGDPTQMEQALGVMQREVEALAKMLGKPVPGVDMLSGHADLQQEVNEGRISQPRAEELAAARHRNAIQTHQSQQRTQVQQTAEQETAAYEQGRQDLNNLGRELSTDPKFKEKSALLATALKPVIARAHPSQWAAIYRDAYAGLVLPSAPKPRTVVPANQPMRAKTPAGGAAKAPGSIAEAIDFGIASASGR